MFSTNLMERNTIFDLHRGVVKLKRTIWNKNVKTNEIGATQLPPESILHFSTYKQVHNLLYIN